MAGTALDTSVLVAAVAQWHEAHERSLRAVDELLAQPGTLVPQQVLLEAYSVLTRLPSPQRLSPASALSVLEQTLEESADVVGLESVATWTFLDDQREAAVAGGAVYDALIIRSALAAGADRILTLNPRHFQRLAPAGLRVLEP
jgi:predicted nucleic acid-binding protein